MAYSLEEMERGYAETKNPAGVKVWQVVFHPINFVGDDAEGRAAAWVASHRRKYETETATEPAAEPEIPADIEETAEE